MLYCGEIKKVDILYNEMIKFVLQLDDSEGDDDELLVTGNIPSKPELPKASDDLQFHGNIFDLFI